MNGFLTLQELQLAPSLCHKDCPKTEGCVCVRERLTWESWRPSSKIFVCVPTHNPKPQEHTNAAAIAGITWYFCYQGQSKQKINPWFPVTGLPAGPAREKKPGFCLF